MGTGATSLFDYFVFTFARKRRKCVKTSEINKLVNNGQMQVQISASGFCLVSIAVMHHPFLLFSVIKEKKNQSDLTLTISLNLSSFAAASNGT